MEIFLGQPDNRFVDWCVENYGSQWDVLTKKLEDYPTLSASLPAIGTSLIVPYKVDPDGDAVDTEWEIIGYNTSIPQYVKYMNGNTRIYVSSVKNGLLSAITAGDVTYVKNSDGSYTADGNSVAAVGQDLILNTEKNCTYGNNCGWTAPATITVDGTTYDFAGYNCNIISKYVLATKYNGTLYHYPQFNTASRNDWSQSLLRTWMNGSSSVSNTWYELDWNSSTSGSNIVGMTGRLTDAKFILHVMPTVNRMWIYSDWTSGKTLDSNSCEHIVDKFWILGVGNINCTGKHDGTEYYKDQTYDTSKFSTIFNQIDLFNFESSHVRRSMKEDGTEGIPCFWWLRSACSNYNNYVGHINIGGSVNNDFINNNLGVLPACTIC